MGDLSTEPSMEEILSSIKRIIAEEGDVTAGRPRRQSRAAGAPLAPAPPTGDDTGEGVLELSDPMPPTRAEPARTESNRVEAPRPEQLRAEPPREPRSAPQPVADATPEAIVSHHAAAASRGALDQLSRMMVKPEPGSDGSLEGLVRDMLRPMLREWLDANLPALVEAMVEREIKRISGTA